MGHLEEVNKPVSYQSSCQRLCFLSVIVCSQDLKWLISVLTPRRSWFTSGPCGCVCVCFNRRISWQQHLLTASLNLPLIQVSISLSGCAVDSWPSSLLQPPGLLLDDGVPCPIWVEKLINLLVLCLPPLPPCRKEWDDLFLNSNYLARIRQAGINGRLRSSRFRSVCWKVTAKWIKPSYPFD